MSSNPAAPPHEQCSDSVLVYVPKPGTAIERTVKRGSAIVGPEAEAEAGRARPTVYFEGNLYGAVGMVTFADRAMHAYWRMRERYPTIAMMTASPQELVRAGTLDPERGVIRDELDARGDLLAWLGIKDVPGDRRILSLQRELCVYGVRASIPTLCPQCRTKAQLLCGEELVELRRGAPPDAPAHEAMCDDETGWRCPNVHCGRFGVYVELGEQA